MGLPRYLLVSMTAILVAALPSCAQTKSLPDREASSKVVSTFSLPTVSSNPPLQTLPGGLGSGTVPHLVGAERRTASGLTAPGFSFRIGKSTYLTRHASCYALRIYRFAETYPASGVMKPLGSSTCEAASMVHLKNVTAGLKVKLSNPR